MARLYVANCTPQKRIFSYRVVGTTQLREQEIRPGEQEVLSGDLQPEAVESIIEQHERYGLVAAHAVQQARAYVHLLYSVGRPVSGAQMKLALDRNLELKTLEGERTRQSATIGMTELVQREHPDSYTGLQVSIRDARKDVDPDINEIHTHRRDGDYGGGTEFGAGLAGRRPGKRKRAA